jgi:hypothetical protein
MLTLQRIEHNLTLPENKPCFLGCEIRNIADVAMWGGGERVVTYLKNYPKNLLGKLRNTTKNPGPYSGWSSWKS